MLNLVKRQTILELKNKGHSIRRIARLLNTSRNSVKKILKQGVDQVPQIVKESILDDYLDRIRELHDECEGNLVRVHEKLLEEFNMEGRKEKPSYSTVTSFCRKHGISKAKTGKVSGEYLFEPGEEMQHDTSPHKVTVGGKKRKLQCASLVLCFSRMIFVQVYENFNRFTAKVFLSEALKYFKGAAGRCMIDNTNVVVARGTGKNATMSPEMVQFGEHFGFVFVAHEKGDANRSAHVERAFHYVEHNFYPGRKFDSLEDLNIQAIQWCDKANNKYKRAIQTTPLELYQKERFTLSKLPAFIPEVDQYFSRTVDLYGNVHLHTNHYSVPDEYVGRQVRVRETKDAVEIYQNHKLIARHKKHEYRSYRRSRIAGHSRKGSSSPKTNEKLLEEESTLRNVSPVVCQYLSVLKKQKNSTRLIRKLHRLYLEYPTDVFIPGVERALKYGLVDLNRLDSIILDNVSQTYFELTTTKEEEL